MKLLFLLLPILYTNVLVKSFDHNQHLKIITEGSYEIIRTKGTRIIVESYYENNAPAKLQDYITSRYSIKGVVTDSLTTVSILKPERKLIVDKHVVFENINSKIYVPEDINIVN